MPLNGLERVHNVVLWPIQKTNTKYCIKILAPFFKNRSRNRKGTYSCQATRSHLIVLRSPCLSNDSRACKMVNTPKSDPGTEMVEQRVPPKVVGLSVALLFDETAALPFLDQDPLLILCCVQVKRPTSRC